MAAPRTASDARFVLRVALATGLVAFGLAVLFGYPTVNPAAWNDLAAAAGLRPPYGSLGGLARGVYLVLFRAFPPDGALLAVRVLGWLCAALVASLSCVVFLHFCGSWLARLCGLRTGRVIVAGAGSAAAIAFLCSDPVWHSMQGLTNDGLQILLALTGVGLLQLFAVRRRRRYALAAMLVWSVLAADIPLAMLGVVAVAVTAGAVCFRAPKADDTYLANPFVRLVLARGLTFVFFAAFGLTAAAEFLWLRRLGGYPDIPSFSASASDVVSYVSAWLSTAAATFPWKTSLLALLVVFAPAVITRVLRDRSMDDEHFMPINVLVTHALVAFLCWSQLAGVRALTFTSWFESCVPTSALQAAVLFFVLAQTFVWTVFVVGASVCLKRPADIADIRFTDALETREGRRTVYWLERVRRWAGPAAMAFPFLLLLCVAPFRGDRTLDGMLRVIDAYLVQTADECAGLTRVFTDGRLDAGLELEAFRRGGRLFTLSSLGAAGGMELALRRRGLVKRDDLQADARGPLALLRTWLNDTPDRLSDAAVQLAFELWRGRADRPVYLGTVALPPTSVLKPDVAACAARGRALGRRIVGLYEKGAPDRAGTAFVRTCFRCVQWRLSRLGEQRAEVEGRERWTDAAAEEQALADRLRELNSAFAAYDRAVRTATATSGALLTPREGLRLGLDRADFNLATLFAAPVLATDPDDPEANFAFGMKHFMAGEHARAEPYLKKCLVRRPDDPAVLNNLAVAELRLCHYDEAERYANEALARLPNSAQIRRTIEAIRKARAPREEVSE